MATIELQRKGADLLYIRNGVQSTTRINLFEIEIDVLEYCLPYSQGDLKSPCEYYNL